ncbi:MAG: hypothetical protein WBV94_26195 [Blastocatellia bacterium]
MGYKKRRLGAKIADAARDGKRYNDIHVFIGGTGAVGGTALLQMLSMYEEMMCINPPSPEKVPILLTTGKGPEDIRAFTRRLFRFVESRYGNEKRPIQIGSGYMTRSGVFIAFERFQLTVLPGLELIHETPLPDRPAFMRRFLSNLEESTDAFATLMHAISQSQPISNFLRQYQAKHYADIDPAPFRSVVLGIPIPSLVAYHLDHLEYAAKYIDGITDRQISELRNAFRQSFRDDLLNIKEELAETVLVAHTTSVGGMYDEEYRDGKTLRKIRLGFAHSAQDDRLIVKQHEAEELTLEYSKIGIKMLITAAAIGIDEVRIRAEVPVHHQLAQKLYDAPFELFPGSKKSIRQGEEVKPARQFVRVYKPLTIPLDGSPLGPVKFDSGNILKPSYLIRSGENGFFTVANADALYRVMRVASASELGQVLATVGLFGDDPLSPWFTDNICYYTETDNSRQVFDLLYQPQLLNTQISGLEPMALQDLGSSKHQGELHTLSLLILLHRIHTFDVNAIDPYIDVDRFDPSRFFIEHSQPLTFEDLANWPIEKLSKEMAVLALANTADEIASLNPGRHSGIFPLKDEALRRVYEQVLQSVWMICSLGSPIVFEAEGKTLIRTGYFVAPLDLLITDHNSVSDWFQKHYEKSGNPCSFDQYRDYHVCTGGFIDLRPRGILCTARDDRIDLKGKLKTFTTVESLRAGLREVEPYTFFTTCGLIALLYRLHSLYSLLNEAMVELGSLHEFRWQMPRNSNGHILLVPGAVEAFRMFSEGLEKNTGTEHLDGIWQYERRVPPDRWNSIPGLKTNLNK